LLVGSVYSIDARCSGSAHKKDPSSNSWGQ
jgi:hypothetical protein